MSSEARPIEALYTDVEWALAQGLPRRELVPMLKRLVAAAGPHSVYGQYARLQLAGLVLQTEPFRAARLAKEVLEHEDDERAHALLGLAHLLLGHYRSSARAFRSALHHRPDCASYAHNLGHVLDLGLEQPEEALVWLRKARRLWPSEREIASSLAHAYWRLGRPAEARKELLFAHRGEQEKVEATLQAWQQALLAATSE